MASATSPQLRPLDLSRAETILTPDAVDFVAALHDRFGARRRDLMTARAGRAAPADFLAETREIRESSWAVAPPRDDYADRRVEITGPTDRKLVINALNSTANGFMADFEDANVPLWGKQIEGHLNLLDAIDGTISYDASDGRHYELGGAPATLIVRPRGLHLDEYGFRCNGAPVAGAFVDFGLHAFHALPRRVKSGQGLYLYLPKLEHHLEARLWNDVLAFAEDVLNVPAGTIRATVLIETLPAAFQMHEMLWELRAHSYGLNAGRWDYIFSTIKCYRDDPRFVTPNRNDVKMTVPFLRAYAELLVQTCHARDAFAMGGMAALIPSRTDAQANQRAIEAVQADKAREAHAGFDGTWVAHPDVVAVAREQFDAVLRDRPNQIDRLRPDVVVTPEDLLNVAATPGTITADGLRNNVSVGFQYVSFWLGGRGAAAINGLMEDAATAEICRTQIWQWIRHGATLPDGRVITRELVCDVLDEEMGRIRESVGETVWTAGHPAETRQVFEHVALAESLPEFLTIAAYELLSEVAASGTIGPMTAFDRDLTALTGDVLPASSFAGQTVLVVNVASRCGLTPQYEGLERLQQRYAGRGFTVLGVPCNQFAGQEPGTSEEIATFCRTTYGATFPMTEKLDVNGEHRAPLYARLTTIADADGVAGDVQWNFEKFLVAPTGEIAARFRSPVEPESDDVIAAIEAVLPARWATPSPAPGAPTD
jgi:malate synthase